MIARRAKLGIVLAGTLVLSGSAEAQGTNPYSGAAGFAYSQGRVAAPGRVGGPVRREFPTTEPVEQLSSEAAAPASERTRGASRARSHKGRLRKHAHR